MSLARRLSLLLLSVATLLAPSTDAVRCLECNEMPGAARIPCPGMELINFGRKFDSCIIYRLNSGRIVFQDKADSSAAGNLCSHKPAYLANVIYRNFGEAGTAMCCKADGCNQDIPAHFEQEAADGGFLYKEEFETHAAYTVADGGGDARPGELTSGDGGNGAAGIMGLSILTMVTLSVTAAYA